MALIPCANCGKPISDKASQCPHCGTIPNTSHLTDKTINPRVEENYYQHEEKPGKKSSAYKVILSCLVILFIGIIAFVVYFLVTTPGQSENEQTWVAPEIPEYSEDLLRRAEEGDSEAQAFVGMLLFQGQGVTANREEGIKWLEKSAEAGNPFALNELGAYYAESRYGIQDPAKAFKYFQQAADQDFTPGIYDLGYAYFHGVGVTQDKEKAFELYTKAAKRGYPLAMLQVGDCYLDGEGTLKDEEEGFSWVQKAADKDFPNAIDRLGYCYITGRGVAKDEYKGFNLCKESMEKGSAPGAFRTAFCYLTGTGTPTDIDQGLGIMDFLAKEEFPETIIDVASLFCDLNDPTLLKRGKKILNKYAALGDERAIAKLQELGLWKK